MKLTSEQKFKKLEESHYAKLNKAYPGYDTNLGWLVDESEPRIESKIYVAGKILISTWGKNGRVKHKIMNRI